MKINIPKVEKAEVVFLDDLTFQGIDAKLKANPIIFSNFIKEDNDEN